MLTLYARRLGQTLLLITLLFGSAAGAVHAVPAGNPTQGDELRAQLTAWAKGLSAEPGFQGFAQAVIDVTPLGPGLHGWLALLRQPGKPDVIGYMIVHATPSGGYQLGEYGLGSYYPFAQQTLREGLERLGLLQQHDKQPFTVERLYPNAMLAAWRIDLPPDQGQAVYLDAKTGEPLPIGDREWEEQSRALTAAPVVPPQQARSAGSLRLVAWSAYGEMFDPYERMPWLTREPLMLKSGTEIAAHLKEKVELRLTFEWFEGSYLHVLPIRAAHAWEDDTVFAAVDQHGLRYLPYDSLIGPYGSIFD